MPNSIGYPIVGPRPYRPHAGETPAFRCSFPEMLGLQNDGFAVRCSAGGAFPGVAVAGEGGAVGDALVGDETLQGIEPMMVIRRAGVGVARRLSMLDLVRQRRRPFGPSEQPAPVQRQRHRECLRLPRLAEDGAFLAR